MTNSHQETPVRWGVVATVDEPLVLLAAFVAHHLSLGAAKIYLYLDRPAADVVAFFADDPMVDVTTCDQAYWAARNENPRVHVRRQLLNSRDAYDRTDVDWLLHCDGDEFVQITGDFAAELAALPKAVQSLRLLNTERVWVEDTPRPSIFSGHQRHPWRRRRGGGWEVYGALDTYMRQGILGYGTGKSMARVGQNLFLGIHDTRLRDKDNWAEREARVKVWESSAARVIHFDGLTPLHWQVKLMRKAQAVKNEDRLADRVGPPRMAQITFVKENLGDPALVKELHDALRVLPSPLVTQLDALGLIDPIEMDIAATTRARFGAAAGLDLSEAAFDAWLGSQFPDTVAALTGA